MKQEDYTKIVIGKLNPDRTITCEDCGKKAMTTHAIIDHSSSSIKVVCNDCFILKYRSGLYGKEYKA